MLDSRLKLEATILNNFNIATIIKIVIITRDLKVMKVSCLDSRLYDPASIFKKLPNHPVQDASF